MAPTQREPELFGQTAVLIGGSAGIGLETARRARAEGADVILTGRNAERLESAAQEWARRAPPPSTLTTLRRWRGSSRGFPARSTTCWSPAAAHVTPRSCSRATSMRWRLRSATTWCFRSHVARNAAPKMRPGGTLIFMGGTGGRKISRGLGIISAATDALPPFIAALALELAPVRVNLIAAGFVDTPLSASLLGDDLDKRREQLRIDSADRARRPTRGRRGARGAHHDQHGAHRRDVRHRRRPAVRRLRRTTE